MTKRTSGENRKSFWNRFAACAALGLYVFALVVMPALHGHSCGHHADTTDTCCQHSEHAPDVPLSDDPCPICEFAHLAIPFFVMSEPLLLQMDIVAQISFTVSIPLVADAAILPTCRAPPVL
jgi:hypothetical protein